MSDKINTDDAVFLAILPELYDGRGWHKKGIPTTNFNPETNQNLKRALFKHRMVQAGVYVGGNFVPGEDFYAVAEDTNKPIGSAVGRVFRTPDNEELYKFFSEAIAGSGYEICSLGTLDSRAEFFIDAKGTLKSVAGREVTPYFGLNRMFGGKGSVVGAGHQTVMQCANTTEIFRSEAYGTGDKLKNTLSIRERLPQFREAIRLGKALEIQFDLAMEDAAKFQVSRDMAREAFAGYLADGSLSTKAINRVNRLLQLFRAGNGNNGENAADWFNAVTDYFTHESAANVDAKDDKEREAARIKQWYASEHGTARKVKAELASKLFNKGAFARNLFEGFCQAGKNLIAKLKDDDKAMLD